MELVIKQLEAECDRLRNQIIENAKWFIDDMEKVVSRLERPEPGEVNSLGVFQGNAAKFDILCARYSDVKHYLDIVRAGKEAI